MYGQWTCIHFTCRRVAVVLPVGDKQRHIGDGHVPNVEMGGVCVDGVPGAGCPLMDRDIIPEREEPCYRGPVPVRPLPLPQGLPFLVLEVLPSTWAVSP